jgi:hypothetical protein
MSWVRLVVAFAAAAGLTACATAKVQSVVDHSRASLIEELSIIVSARDPDVAKHFAEIVGRKLTAIGVGNDFRVAPSGNEEVLRLEEDGDMGAAARMMRDAPRPMVLLAQVTFTRGIRGAFNSVSPDQFEMSFAIYPRGDGRAVWKSQAKVSLVIGQAGWGSETSLLDKIAESFIAQLRTDGLLPRAPDEARSPRTSHRTGSYWTGLPSEYLTAAPGGVLLMPQSCQEGTVARSSRPAAVVSSAPP